MNYQAHYDRLIERARGRVLAGYSERHHVVPKCLGGRNDKPNLVRLTAEEHFVAHQLLVKLNPGNSRIAFAAVAMSHDNWGHRQGNKLYGWLRRRAVSMPITDETRAKLSASHKGKKWSEETIAKRRGEKRTAESIARMRIAQKKVNRVMSAEQRARVSAVHKGKTISPEQREQISIRNLGRTYSVETKKRMSSARSAHWEKIAPEQRSIQALKGWEKRRLLVTQLNKEQRSFL